MDPRSLDTSVLGEGSSPPTGRSGQQRSLPLNTPPRHSKALSKADDGSWVSGIHDLPKPRRSGRHPRKPKCEPKFSLSDDMIEELIEQRNSQFDAANQTRKMARAVGWTMQQPHNMRICSTTCSPVSNDPSQPKTVNSRANIRIQGMRLKVGDGNPQPGGCSQTAIDDLQRYKQQVGKVSIATGDSGKSDFTRGVQSGRRNSSVPLFSRGSQSLKFLGDTKTFAMDSAQAHESLNMSGDQVLAVREARAKDGMEARLQGEAEKREARRRREEAVLQARETYGTTKSQQRDMEQRERNTARLEEQLNRVKGLAIFSSHAPRYIVVNIIIIVIVLAIILDLHIPNTYETRYNTTHFTSEHSKSVMKLYNGSAFVVYAGTLIGACVALVGSTMVYIFANYRRITFFICCNGGSSGNQTLDYITRISGTATACSYITASFQIITIWPHCRATIGLATAEYAQNLAEGLAFGEAAFALAMLGINYLLPAFLLLSLYETKVLSHTAYPLLFGAKNAPQREKNQNIHLFVQAVVITIMGLFHLFQLNTEVIDVIGFDDAQQPINIVHFHLWMSVIIALLTNGLNIFTIFLGKKEEYFERDSDSLAERLQTIETIGRATIQKGALARIGAHKNSKLKNRVVQVEMDLADCPTTSDRMAIVEVTVLDGGKRIKVEEFQLVPNCDEKDLIERKERSELQAAEAKDKNHDLEGAIATASKASALITQILTVNIVALLLICVRNGPLSAQAILIYIQDLIMGHEGTSATMLNRMKSYPTDIDDPYSKYYHAKGKIGFIDQDRIEWTMLWYVVGFAAGGAIVGLLLSRFAYRLGGCKNLTVTLLFMIVSAFLGMGFSTATHALEPGATLYYNDGVNPERLVDTSAPSFSTTEPICSAVIATQVYENCMLSTFDKLVTRRSDSLENFLLFGLQINMLVIMLENIGEKQRQVTDSSGPESWALQSGKVFMTFTLFIFVPLNLFLAYFMGIVDPSHTIGGVHSFFINAIGAYSDWLESTGSVMKGSIHLVDYRAVLVAMYSQLRNDVDVSHGVSIYVIFLAWTTTVHIGVYATLRRVPEYSPHTITGLRVLVLAGYLPPMLYSIRGLYLGLFAPSLVNNTNAMVYMVFIGMGGYFLQACTTSKVLPIYDYLPRFWGLQLIYYITLLVPLFSAISMVLAISGAWVYEDAIHEIATFNSSRARDLGSCMNSSCMQAWPTYLAYVALVVFMIWIAALLLVYGRRIPGLYMDIQFVVVNDLLPWLTERFPICAGLFAGCCKDDNGEALDEGSDGEEANEPAPMRVFMTQKIRAKDTNPV